MVIFSESAGGAYRGFFKRNHDLGGINVAAHFALAAHGKHAGGHSEGRCGIGCCCSFYRPFLNTTCPFWAVGVFVVVIFLQEVATKGNHHQSQGQVRHLFHRSIVAYLFDAK